MTRLPDLPGVLSASQLRSTAEAIAAVQLPNGMIPWFPGGHADAWNHTEAAMALVVGGLLEEADRAFDWLASTQRPDGSWFNYYLTGDVVEDHRLDTNVITYVAVGAWHRFAVTGDRGFLESVWPMVDRAIEFALALQQPGGEVLWSREPHTYVPAQYALLTGSSSVCLSLRAAASIASTLGVERPEWELAALRLAGAIAHDPTAFEPKDRWAMDWYYPILSGAVTGDAGAARLDERWAEFAMEGLGIRCVADRPWVTAAESAECVLALDAVGREDQARRLLTWLQYLRHEDGSYWTGCVHPEETQFPGGERSTYTAAAVLLAADALGRFTPASGLFRGDGLLTVATGDGLAAPVH